MDLGSINKQSRHIHDVQRLQTELDILDPEDKENRLESQKEHAKLRWLNCRRSFAMLFMTLNRGNKFPVDEFRIKVDSKQHGNTTYDTYVRVWRTKDHKTYYAKPYIDCGNNILDQSFATESFGNEHEYRFGTHRSHMAKVVFENDVDIAEVMLTRVNGYLVEEMTDKNTAIFLSALEDQVLPALEQTESTLALITGSILKNDLNPQFAERVRLQEHGRGMFVKKFESNPET